MSERRPPQDDRADRDTSDTTDTRHTGDTRDTTDTTDTSDTTDTQRDTRLGNDDDHGVDHGEDRGGAHRGDHEHGYDRDRSHRHDADAEERRHEEFGGANLGAALFGWLVAVAMTVLLAGIIGAVATGVGESLEISQAEAEAEASSIGLGAGIALVVALMIAYYAGGYVAGRMSRYDGGRQGLAVWVIGLLLTLLAALIGVIFGSQYDVVDRVDLPSIPVPTDTITTAGIVTLAAVVVGTLLAAMLGGKAGHRYHRKVDRFVG